MKRIFLPIVLMLSIIGCTKTTVSTDGSGVSNPVAPDTTDTPTTVSHKIHYVVNGSILQPVNIKYSSAEEGTQILKANVPWEADFKVKKNVIFLSISATTFEAGYVSVQIWVDDKLFRETVISSDFPDTVTGITAVISGTYDLSDLTEVI